MTADPDIPSRGLLLRAARTSDVPACATILNQWIDATEWIPRVHTPAEVERHYREHVLKVHKVLVAERDHKVCGFLALSRDGLVTALYVSVRTRGEGVGKALLDRAKSLRPEGLTLWTFQHNLAARRFYHREGFSEVRRTEGDNEEGLPDILMAWRGPDG